MPASDARRIALNLLSAALAQVEGRGCVRSALASRAPSGPVGVLAVGKAAAAMTLGALDALNGRLARALVITKDGHSEPALEGHPGITIRESAHPVPDARSLAAGALAFEWVRSLPAGLTPLFLISGGASSLIEHLQPGVSLEDLTQMTAEGLASGIPIGELNARRVRLSRIKGGGLTAALAGRPALALFLSDVPGDDPAVIGSGLLGPAREGPDAVERRVIASIDTALAAAGAAARAAGLCVHVAPERFEGEAGALARRFAGELLASPAQVCLWGGESTVQLPQRPGTGGRNQHLALAAAAVIAGTGVAFLAAGTDGTDGPTDQAGGFVDGGTAHRLTRAGIDIDDCLRRADAGTALAASGDLLTTGPTGTNVGDLIIGVAPARGRGGVPVL